MDGSWFLLFKTETANGDSTWMEFRQVPFQSKKKKKKKKKKIKNKKKKEKKKNNFKKRYLKLI